MLLDEPFAALDEMTRDRLNEEILRLRAEREWTAVFVTHSVAEAVFLSDRVVVLAPGPGRIHAEFSVALPAPRTSALRPRPEFRVDGRARVPRPAGDVARMKKRAATHSTLLPCSRRFLCCGRLSCGHFVSRRSCCPRPGRLRRPCMCAFLLC